MTEQQQLESLVENLGTAREHFREVRNAIQHLEGQIIKMLEERSATVLLTPTWHCSLKPQQSYQYQDEVLSELRMHIEASEWLSIQEHIIKWDKRRLNMLLKRGDPIKGIIEQGITTIPGVPKIELEKR